jgi:translation initiation factor 4A
MKVECFACIGGTSVGDDIRMLEAGVHIVVGTPGRVFHMVSEGHLKVDKLKMFILDEADEMLGQGFKA